MPGLVLKILASEGDQVTEGQPVLVLEAMKMENVLSAPTDGIISEILVTSGKNVNKGQVLVRLD
jgi:biotin carboxyl carrier protein